MVDDGVGFADGDVVGWDTGLAIGVDGVVGFDVGEEVSLDEGGLAVGADVDSAVGGESVVDSQLRKLHGHHHHTKP